MINTNTNAVVGSPIPVGSLSSGGIEEVETTEGVLVHLFHPLRCLLIDAGCGA
ncbi:hypothetical protein [Streptomyces sp. NPDC058086]|uniref:hypothetical protein n=1 Tax=Streptomyces sp. NPDC058086 TaxID=3346334 RepID=UPI0036F056AE